MKHTIRVSPGLTFVVEDRAIDVQVTVQTPLFSKTISIGAERAAPWLRPW